MSLTEQLLARGWKRCRKERCGAWKDPQSIGCYSVYEAARIEKIEKLPTVAWRTPETPQF